VPGEQSRYLWFGKDGEEDVYMVVQADDLMMNSNENWFNKFVDYSARVRIRSKTWDWHHDSWKQLPKERMIILPVSQEHYATEIVAGCRLPECRRRDATLPECHIPPLSTLTTLTTTRKTKRAQRS
jgi:hypothetical protein